MLLRLRVRYCWLVGLRQGQTLEGSRDAVEIVGAAAGSAGSGEKRSSRRRGLRQGQDVEGKHQSNEIFRCCILHGCTIPHAAEFRGYHCIGLDQLTGLVFMDRCVTQVEADTLRLQIAAHPNSELRAILETASMPVSLSPPCLKTFCLHTCGSLTSLLQKRVVKIMRGVRHTQAHIDMLHITYTTISKVSPFTKFALNVTSAHR